MTENDIRKIQKEYQKKHEKVLSDLEDFMYKLDKFVWRIKIQIHEFVWGKP